MALWLPLRAESTAAEPAGLDPPAEPAEPAVAPPAEEEPVAPLELEAPLVLDAPDEAAGCVPAGADERDPPPPTDGEGAGIDGFGTDGVGSDGFGIVGVGSDGVLTVGVGSDGVLTVGTVGTGSGTEGVVTGGVTGVEGTVSEGTVSALACPTRPGPPISVRTRASSPNPSPQRTPRPDHRLDPRHQRIAASLPLISLHIYPALRNSNRR